MSLAQLKFWIRARQQDFIGGAVSAATSIPIESSYGLFAFSVLAAEYGGLGVQGILWCMIVGTTVMALAGSRGALFCGIRPVGVVLIGGLLTTLITLPSMQGPTGPDIAKILAALSLAVVLAGAIQVTLGLLGFGRVVKFLPYPVLAGFMNGMAILMMLALSRTVLGLPKDIPWSDLLTVARAIEPLTLLLAAVTGWLFLQPPAKRWRLNLPPPIFALISGVVLYYVIGAFVSKSQLGPTFAALPTVAPNLGMMFDILGLFEQAGFSDLLTKTVLPFALSFAILATFETLVVASALDGITLERNDSNRETIAQGVGNMSIAMIGGLPSTASVARSMTSISLGGKTRYANFSYSLTTLVLVLLAGSIFQYIPKVAVAGVLMVIAWNMVDEWSRKTPAKLLKEGLTAAQKRRVALEYGIMMIVTAVTVAGHLVVAVLIGVIVATAVFMRRAGRTIVRDVYRCDSYQSLTNRTPQRTKILETQGSQIVLIELEGSLFFGTVDRLSEALDKEVKNSRYVILDFRRVTEIDGTGARLLKQLAAKFAGSGKQIAFGGLRLNGPRGRMLSAQGVDAAVPTRFWFADPDEALQWAEDEVIASVVHRHQELELIDLQDTTVAANLEAWEVAQLKHYFEFVTFPAGTCLFRAGDQDHSLFVSLKGTITLCAKVKSETDSIRVAALEPGVAFGEMALLDCAPRSADALAQTEVSVLKLNQRNYQRLQSDHPALSAKLLSNLTLQLSRQLRAITRELSMLRA